MHSRGQSAIEMLFSYVLVFVIVALVMVVVSEDISQIRVREERMFAERVALNFAEEIDVAWRVGDGYQRTFYNPYDTIELNNRTGFVCYESNVCTTILARSIIVENHVPVGERYLIKKGDIVIKNKGGVIYIIGA